VLFGVEFDPSNAAQSGRIDDCYERNLGAHMVRRDVCEVDPAELPYVDWFHASPVCKSFSVANAQGGERDIDIATAEATSRYIIHHRPQFVTIENVWAYRESEAWFIIARSLMAQGYQFRVDHVNMADYGVPQTRKRMIVQATLDNRLGVLPPTHTKEPIGGGWFGDGLPRWISWYEAIEDLLDGLPESEFAPWQLNRLPESITGDMMFSNHCGTDGYTTVNRVPSDAPAFSVVISGANQYRAFLMDGGNAQSNGREKYKWAHDPARTVVSGDGPARAWANGRVVKMSPRALARFQTLPDWYELPERASDAVTIIGNGVPCLFMQRVGERFAKLANEVQR
jgi:DNA (cytosine-5)-methyltransferase 1